jgi:ABC-2 type transport system ATP-binding protein
VSEPRANQPARNDGSGRITVDQLTKRFGPVTAVDGLTFRVEPGEVTGFLGPNGSGKTTTLRMLLGLVHPSWGEARINGARYGELRQPARVVGAVLDVQGFHPGRSARNHLRACAAAIGTADTAVEHVLAAVGLADVARYPVRRFSLGMRQRLALATALLGDPQVLILDEPANGLDPEGIAWLRAFLRGLAGQGRTVLFSSHLLAEVEQTVDQVIVISRGQCLYHGGLAQLRGQHRPRLLVRCGDPGRLADTLAADGLLEIDTLPDGRLGVAGAEPGRVGDLALAAGVPIYEMVGERIDLEQIFLRLTALQSSPPPSAPWTDR